MSIKQRMQSASANALAYIKSNMIKVAVGVCVFLIVMSVVSGGGKKQGHPMFGICKTYLELNTRYPGTLKYTIVEQYKTAVRICYNYTTPFGGLKSDFIECSFDNRPGDVRLKAIYVDRKQQPREKVDEFNKTLRTILASNPDLSLPPAFDPEIKKLNPGNKQMESCGVR